MEYQQEEIQHAITYVENTIHRCEEMIGKFIEGTSQHTLLVNRIHALKVTYTLLTKEDKVFTIKELQRAVAPIDSIIQKTKKAQMKYERGTTTYRRFQPILDAMNICETVLNQEILNNS